MLERQHPAAGVFDEYDLGRAEELLADDDAAEGVYGGGAGLLCVSLEDERRFALVARSTPALSR